MTRYRNKCSVVMRLGALSAVLACALFGCAGSIDEESDPEDVGSIDQSITVNRDLVCPDAGQKVFYAHARIQFQEVGGSVNGPGCVNPSGCVTHYHVCDRNGCGSEVSIGWPGDAYCASH